MGIYEEYVKIKKLADKYKKEVDKLKGLVLENMKKEGKNTLECEDSVLEVVKRENIKMNKEKALDKIKENGYLELIKVQEEIDEDKVVDYIVEGKIEEDFLNEFIETSIMEYVKMGKIKKKRGENKNED